MKQIAVSIIKVFFSILALVPMPFLYIISDGIFIILYHIIGYRRNVVSENLRMAFPGKDENFLKETERNFYRHLSDIIVEFIKIPVLSKKDIMKRVRFTNPEFLEKYFSEKKQVIAVTSHMNNWEWGGLALSGLFPDINVSGVYKPLSSQIFDNIFRDLRKKFGMHLVPMKSTLRAAMSGVGKPGVLVLISDQSPTFGETEMVTSFMNREVPVFLGAEKIASLTRQPIVYFAMRKTRRGIYEVETIPVSENPEKMPQFEITLRHLRLLESEIAREPANWLWSHRRWKHSGKKFSPAVVKV